MRRAGVRGALLLVPCAVAACGGGSTAAPHASTSASASATPQLAGTQRTVLSPLGLNVHSDPATSASVVATASQGVLLTVLDYRSDNGGWFKVMGQSTTGWITADPSLTASGTFTPYSSDARMFSVLIPSSWTFSEETSDVVFRPQQGARSIVVRTAATTAALGQEAPTGYAMSFTQQEIVCGYTGQLDEYVRAGSSAATPSASPANGGQRLGNYAAIRLTLDAMHAIELALNYEKKDDLQTFRDFYNSITFPFPLCQAPAATPSAAVPPT
ncbi:MAG: SH3 domain-containing protein [Candidatus Dormibacteria bacterium]